MFRNRQLNGGLLMFFFQFLLQAGIFFVVPLYLSVDLELSAMATGVRVMPLSIALLVAALGVPKLWPHASPRRVTRVGILLMLAGIITLLSGITLDSGPAVVTIPLLLVGLGIGALASQLGAVTVSSVPTHQSGEVGGLQNTATNLGASLGTALAGSMLLSVLTASLIAGIRDNPQIPQSVAQQASVQLASGVPFLSDSQAQAALDKAGVPADVTTQVLDANAKARTDGLDAALAVLAMIAVISLLFSGRIPEHQPVGDETDADPVAVA
jgi:MFS family permease